MPWVNGEYLPDGPREAQAFEVGNKIALRHGIGSPSVVAERAQEIQASLQEHFPFLGDPMFTDSFERCCSAQARVSLLSNYIDTKVSEEGVESVAAYLWTELSRAESNAQKFAQDCGLDPIGFAKLAKELGWAKQLAGNQVASLVSRGKQLRAAQGE